MKTPISRLLLLLLLLLLTNSSVEDEGDFVEQICKKTPFYDLCISTLRSSSNGSGSSDVKGLASTMVNIVLANASDTLSYIRGEINQTSDPDMERALAYCAELYIPVVKYNLPQAIEALSKGEFEFASEGISDAAKEADACQNKLPPPGSVPLTQRNKLLHNLSHIALAILNLIH